MAMAVEGEKNVWPSFGGWLAFHGTHMSRSSVDTEQ